MSLSAWLNLNYHLFFESILLNLNSNSFSATLGIFFFWCWGSNTEPPRHPTAKLQLQHCLSKCTFYLYFNTCWFYTLMGYMHTSTQCWAWEPKEEMSEYPIPHEEHSEPCTLRRSYEFAFLHLSWKYGVS
jgi:hypothetical protein